MTKISYLYRTFIADSLIVLFLFDIANIIINRAFSYSFSYVNWLTYWLINLSPRIILYTSQGVKPSKLFEFKIDVLNVSDNKLTTYVVLLAPSVAFNFHYYLLTKCRLLVVYF